MQLVIQVLKESSLCYQLSTGTNVFCKCSVARCFVLCLLELRICDWCEIFFSSCLGAIGVQLPTVVVSL